MDSQTSVPEITSDNSPHTHVRARRGWLAPAITLALGIIIVASTYQEGLRRGMDHAAAFGPESEQAAIAVAVSDLVYHLNAGYLGYATVRDRLVSIWNQGAKGSHDPILYENNKNRDLLNLAIKSAASLGPQQPGYVGDRSLITTVYDDIGFVDYAKLSFRLFGFRIEALHHTFFVLLGLSALGFLWTFRADISAQVVLLFTLFAFLIETHTAIFTLDMPTFAGMRHGSTLALIPMWYFAFLLLRGCRFPVRPRPSQPLNFHLSREQVVGLLTIIISLFQLAVLILAIKIRGSAMWSVLFVLSVGVVRAGIPWWRAPGPRSYRLLLRDLCAWPTILVVGGLFLHSQYMRLVLHPVYFTDDIMPYHGLWHSAYLGLLEYFPEIVDPKSAEIARSGKGLDAAAYAAAAEYLQRTHFLAPGPDLVPTGYISPWTNTLKFRLHDEIMRRVFFDVATRHPFKVAELYIVKKPWAIYAVIEEVFRRTPTLTWMWLGFLGGLAGCLALARREEYFEASGRVALLIAAVIPFAMLPNLWAYPAFHTIADLFLACLALFQACVAVTIALAIRVILNLAHEGGWRHEQR